MARIVTHTGEFMSKAGTLYRVDIWRKGDEQPTNSQPEELRFEAVEPLVIDWGGTSKETPICGSTATLSIESPGDRTYINLYTVKPGEIGLDVYREGALYWRGTLDPESYEEPYERADLYPVSLTFSDFGMLDRVAFTPRVAVVSLGVLLMEGARLANLGDLPLDDSLVALSTVEGKAVAQELCAKAANFVDEDGKPMTMREAMEAMLQPCGLKLMQRAGRLWLFDLQGLYAKAPTRWAEWSSDKQRLAVDKVANAVTLNFSPYAQTKILDASDLKFTKRVNVGDALKGSNSAEGRWVIYTDKKAAERAKAQGANALDQDRARRREAEFMVVRGDYGAFRIIPLRGGAEAVGVMSSYMNKGETEMLPFAVNDSGGTAMAHRSSRVYLPPLKTLAALSAKERAEVEAREKAELDAVFKKIAEDARTWMATGIAPKMGDATPISLPRLRIKMECLMDVRYNPFAEAPKPDATNEDGNDGGTYNWMKRVAAWCFTPMKVALYDSATALSPVKTYSNEVTAYGAVFDPLNGVGFNGWPVMGNGWKDGEGGLLWLAYYPEPESINEDSALLKGWATNRPCIGRPDYSWVEDGQHAQAYGDEAYREKFKWLQRLSGEFIDYPPEGGWLEISYGGGVVIHDYKGSGKNGDALKHGEDNFKNMSRLRALGVADKLRWLLFKAPEVEVVRDWGDFGTVTVDDVETRATLHPDAREELKFSLKCGTLPNNDTEGEAVARGVYVNRMGMPLRQLKRADRVDSPERLFINSLYSQYATRCARISGEAAIDPEGLARYREHAQGNSALFIATATRQDLMEDCGDVTLVRLINEHYRPTFDA